MSSSSVNAGSSNRVAQVYVGDTQANRGKTTTGNLTGAGSCVAGSDYQQACAGRACPRCLSRRNTVIGMDGIPRLTCTNCGYTSKAD